MFVCVLYFKPSHGESVQSLGQKSKTEGDSPRDSGTKACMPCTERGEKAKLAPVVQEYRGSDGGTCCDDKA